MCVIIDANRATRAFDEAPVDEARPLIDWITTKGGIVVIGGQLTDELKSIRKARRWLLAAVRAGRAREYRRDRIEAEQESLLQSGFLSSNDPHVLALARVSGARLLYSHDQALITDFKNADIINGPRGKVYKTDKNANLLKVATCS